MMKRLLILLLALLLAALPSLAEEPEPTAEIPPEELGEFELGEPEQEPGPEATPEPAAQETPLPTLEPGSLNYPADKINFEAEIWSILTRRWKLADYQAAGLMSSLYAESSFCPYNAQGKDGVDNRSDYSYRAGDGVGFGLCQWTSSGRKDALRRYAEAHGDANLVWDFDIQMGYMESELDFDALKTTQTLYEATEWTVLRYERPNQAYKNSWPGSRYGIALQIFEAHTGKPYEEPPLAFDARTEDGANALEGFILFTSGELDVTSNYYWRLTACPMWAKATSPGVYDPETWGPCACGYGGATPIRLEVPIPPAVREGELTFKIYRDGGEKVSVPFTYAGPSLASFIAKRLEPFFALWKAALLFA